MLVVLGKGVYIPQGNYLVTSHIIVNNVTLTGAGSWYSVLGGAPTSSTGTGVGVFGNTGTPSTNINLSNFAIEGQITNRIDCIQDNGIGGAMSNSTISNVWIEHTKVGMWFDGPFSGLTITSSRIDSTTADGINFHAGISNSTVTQTVIRGTGDDGLALWSDIVGGRNGSQLYKELTAQGYKGSSKAMYNYLATLRTPRSHASKSSPSKPQGRKSTPSSPAPLENFSAQRATWLFVCQPEKLDERQKRELALTGRPVQVQRPLTASHKRSCR